MSLPVVPAPFPGATFADGHGARSIVAKDNRRSDLAARARSTARTCCDMTARREEWKSRPAFGRDQEWSIRELHAGVNSAQRQADGSFVLTRIQSRQTRADANATPL